MNWLYAFQFVGLLMLIAWVLLLAARNRLEITIQFLGSVFVSQNDAIKTLTPLLCVGSDFARRIVDGKPLSNLGTFTGF